MLQASGTIKKLSSIEEKKREEAINSIGAVLENRINKDNQKTNLPENNKTDNQKIDTNPIGDDENGLDR